jgi:type IV pilus assembly protein PilC
MPKFSVTVQDSNNKISYQSIDADSRVAAVRQVRAKGLVPLDVKMVGDEQIRGGVRGEKVKAKGGAASKKARPLLSGGPKKVKILDVVIFCRLLSIAVSAGLPLREALEGILAPMPNNQLAATLRPAIESLHAGVPFSDALTMHNKYRVFSPVFIGLVRVAEETGTLAETLSSLSDYLSDMMKMRSSIKSKTSYPIFMISAFVVVNLFATFFLFPMFDKNFSSLGSLPPLTEFVFAANKKAIAVFPYVAGALFLLIVWLVMLCKTPIGRRKFDASLLKLPLMGDVLLKTGLARFCKTLAITVNGGVALVQGLGISNVVVGNKHLENSLTDVRKQVTEGNRFAATLRATGNFPDLVVRMIDIGEESGQLPQVLSKIAEIYETEVANAIAKMLSMIEPIIICVFGVFVTIMVLALYMPVFSMSANAH